MEFIAFNPGDWMLHSHMVHHMMNHMVKQVGPRIRNSGPSIEDYMEAVSGSRFPSWPVTQKAWPCR